MPLRKPVLGYASQTDAILALGRKGWDDARIAHMLGMQQSNVRSARNTGRRAAVRREQGVPNVRTVELPYEVLQDLAPYAQARGVHVNALVRKLIDLVVADSLVDAILDDGGSP